MNLAYKYPIIFWNTACLITDSGALSEEDNDSTDYAKIARSIGSIKSKGIEVAPPNIEQSDFGFTPDVEKNKILFGLKPILNINSEISLAIIENRPYKDFYDFLEKVNPNKKAMIALIKSGALDEFYDGDRRFILMLYLWIGIKKKEKINLQNFAGLIKYDLVPNELRDEVRLFNLTKELRKSYKKGEKFILDEKMTNYILKYDSDLEEYGIDNFYNIDSSNLWFLIKDWEKYYKKRMMKVKSWMDENQNELIEKVNDIEFLMEWEKYKGKDNLSAWEMEALCYYDHPHELTGLDYNVYGISNFSNLPEEPEIEKSFKKKDVVINLYKIRKIIGTVVAKDKNKYNVSLLTLEGNVVTVKFPKDYFTMFDKQISERGEDGKKRVKEKSWFAKGNIIMVQGYRRGNEFVAKRYSKTPGHTLYKIVEFTKDKRLILTSDRYTSSSAIEEEGED